ncbi:hypothetical protein LCGC14_1497830 [marine sediment metagenome]|uniref:Uncharacterized protein n=1 Tax=marine sediment metagenome TaxID=412755 RepID=A0A0F9J4Z4_9ZZZZ
MKFIKELLLICALSLALGAFPAYAADDADCVGAVQNADVNLSDGMGTLCIPAILSDGSTIPVVKTLSCSVIFKDGNGAVLTTETFTGSPGSAHDLPVPMDGVGTGEATCVLDALSSTVSTVGVTFPTSVTPAEPIIIE